MDSKKISGKELGMIGVLVVVVLGLLYFLVLLPPLKADKKDFTTKIADLKAMQVRIEEQAGLLGFTDHPEDFKKEFDKINEDLPEGLEAPNLNDYLYKIRDEVIGADKADAMSFTVGQSNSLRPQLETNSISVSLTATYEDIQKYIATVYAKQETAEDEISAVTGEKTQEYIVRIVDLSLNAVNDESVQLVEGQTAPKIVKADFKVELLYRS